MRPVFILVTMVGNSQRGRAKRIVRLWGGKTHCNVPPPNPVLKLRKWDLSGLCPFHVRRMTLREQRGGGKSYHKWGGPIPFLGEVVLWCVFP